MTQLEKGCIGIMINFFRYLFNLFERQLQEKDEESSFLAWFTPHLAARPTLEQAEASSLELRARLPRTRQRPCIGVCCFSQTC